MAVRTVVAAVAALLVAIQIVRNAAVHALVDTRPAAAASAWSGHPASEISLAMTDIARASRARRPVPQSAFAEIADAAAKEPLAPEPFLVRGVQAQLAGDGATAQRAFEAAQWRAPRSLPAAYFLADRYFRSGDVPRGLREAAALFLTSDMPYEAVRCLLDADELEQARELIDRHGFATGPLGSRLSALV